MGKSLLADTRKTTSKNNLLYWGLRNERLNIRRSNDGTYEQVPNRNLAQENYSDNFVVIANQVGGVVKGKNSACYHAPIRWKYTVPSLESVEELIRR